MYTCRGTISSATVEMTRMPTQITVKIESASNLKKVSTFSRMDPYVRVSVGTMEKKTNVRKDEDRNPKWFETFNFPYNGENNIKFSIFDRERIGSDDWIGASDLALHPIATGTGKYNGNLMVIGENGKDCGQLKINLTFDQFVGSDNPSALPQQYGHVPAHDHMPAIHYPPGHIQSQHLSGPPMHTQTTPYNQMPTQGHISPTYHLQQQHTVAHQMTGQMQQPQQIPGQVPNYSMSQTGVPMAGTGVPMAGTGVPMAGTGVPMMGSGVPMMGGGMPPYPPTMAGQPGYGVVPGVGYGMMPGHNKKDKKKDKKDKKKDKKDKKKHKNRGVSGSDSSGSSSG